MADPLGTFFLGLLIGVALDHFHRGEWLWLSLNVWLIVVLALKIWVWGG